MGKQSIQTTENDINLMEIAESIKNGVSGQLHTALPGIIESFDRNNQTAVVQTAIRRRVRQQDGSVKEEKDPFLLDVPVLFLGGGGSALTFPVKHGDECLVIFSEMNIDAWFQSGGVQGQIYPRRHDLSDGFAIVGFRSMPNKLEDVPSDMPEIDNLRVTGKIFGAIEGTINRADFADRATLADRASNANNADNADKLGGRLAGDYALSAHNHDERYARKDHLHDEKYAQKLHNHLMGDITGLPKELNSLEDGLSKKADTVHGHQWSDISGIPNTFPPDAHNHTVADIKDFPKSMPASDVHSWAKEAVKPAYDWVEIQNKPSSFPASPHKHSMPEITGLDQALSGKLNSTDISDWAKAKAKPSYSFSEITGILSQEHGGTGTTSLNEVLKGYLPLSGGKMTGMLDAPLIMEGGTALDDRYANKTHTHTKGDILGLDADIETEFRGMLESMYPVGSIILTTENNHPIVSEIGTWEKIEGGRFLVAANEDHPAGEKGGEAFHTLTIAEMPPHGHAGGLGVTPATNSGYAQMGYQNLQMRQVSEKVGGGKPFDKRPPYYAVWMFRRIA